MFWNWMAKPSPRRGRRSRKGNRANTRPISFRPLVELLEERWLLSTFTVTNPSDSGALTLRDAINQLDAPGSTIDKINFNIGTGVRTITLASALPAIDKTVTIDGSPSLVAGQTIVLDGANLSFGNGLTVAFSAAGSVIEGLVIEHFAHGAGIELDGGNNLIEGNFLGTDAAGTSPAGNFQGLWINDSANNTIGGTAPPSLASPGGTGNLISGDLSDGVLISGPDAAGNLLQGNYIGTDITGTTILGPGGKGNLGNHGNGISLTNGAFNNSIGGTASGARNLVSGNEGDGLFIDGIVIIGGGASSAQTKPSTTEPSASGLLQPNFATSGNLIQGNFIGTDVTGTKSLGNVGNGVELNDGASNNTVGGTTAGAGNLISGNGNDGIFIADDQQNGTSANLAQGNYIGTDLSGKHPLANGGTGVDIRSGAFDNTIGGIGAPPASLSQAGAGNLISANLGDGVYISDSGTTGNSVLGNFIGTDITGTKAGVLGNVLNGVEINNGAGDNTIGGATAGAGNLISGNGFDGIRIAGAAAADSGSGSSANLVQGNFIGTDITGSVALGNTNHGVEITGGASGNTIGGTSAGTGNLISGNNNNGVALASSGNLVVGNLIGVDATDSVPVGNHNAGILLKTTAANNTIGGVAPGTPNVISGNHVGIEFAGSVTANAVLNNLIGTDRGQTLSLGNDIGMLFDGSNNIIDGTSPVTRNVLEANGIAVELAATAQHNLVEGLVIGKPTLTLPNVVGMVILGSDNTIGGTTLAAHNVISGNTGDGMRISGSLATGNVVLGNYIGTDATGSKFQPNGGNGIVINNGASGNTIGGIDGPPASLAGFGNLISGNAKDGILLTGAGTSHNVVAGNYVGTDITGTKATGNGDQSLGNALGVEISGGATANTIGGTAAGAGNLISNNGSEGIRISGSTTTGNLVQGNFIGTDVTGTHALGNFDNGVMIDFGAFGNTIGGATAGAGNLISGNDSNGILIGEVQYSTTTANVAQGNYIGTDVHGTGNLGNGYNGVEIYNGATNNTIGGYTPPPKALGSCAGAGNLISANSADGVLMADPFTTGNVLLGNYIGTDPTGETNQAASGTSGQVSPLRGGGLTLGNGGNGVEITGDASSNSVGGSAAGAGNLISGNQRDGVLITNFFDPTMANVVQGNYIGTDVSGKNALGNSQNGVEIAGGAINNTIGGATPPPPMLSAAGAGNLISGNLNDGILIQGSGTANNLVQGNFIGTDVTGTTAYGNNGTSMGNQSNGVEITNQAADNTLGGTDPRTGNLISGNQNDGIHICMSTTGNLVVGNFIGTDVTGTAIKDSHGQALGNGAEGVDLVGGTTGNTIGGLASPVSLHDPYGTGNLISGNLGDGINISDYGTSGNQVVGNFIGTDLTGTKALGNKHNGVFIQNSANHNTIGGTATGAANVIAFNGDNGVVVGYAMYDNMTIDNPIETNAIFSNAQLGIDLGDDGITPNTPGGPHDGPNDLQNFPILTKATVNATGVVTILGSLNSTPNTTFRVELFANATQPTNGVGQGQVYLGFVMVTTDGKGNASFSVAETAPNFGSSPGFIAATATDANGNTSEFSADVAITKAPPLPPLPVAIPSAPPPPLESSSQPSQDLVILPDRSNGPTTVFALPDLSRKIPSGTIDESPGSGFTDNSLFRQSGTSAVSVIMGDVFEDFNADGVLNPGEPRLPGVKVFLDLNNNGVYDDGEPVTSTDERGQFSFTGLNPGKYMVRQLLPNSMQQTTPPGDAGQEVQVGPGKNVITGVNFGAVGVKTKKGRKTGKAPPPTSRDDQRQARLREEEATEATLDRQVIDHLFEELPAAEPGPVLPAFAIEPDDGTTADCGPREVLLGNDWLVPGAVLASLSYAWTSSFFSPGEEESKTTTIVERPEQVHED